MKLMPDLVCLSLDNDVVVFSQEAQQIVVLSPSAALVFSKLQLGMAAAEIAQALANEAVVAQDEASRWVTTTLDALRSHGMLAGGPAQIIPSTRTSAEDQSRTTRRIAKMPPFPTFESAADGYYRLLGTSALIRFAHLAQRRMVDAAIGHLATDSCPAPAIVLDIYAVKLDDGQIRSNLYRNRAPVDYAAKLSFLGPIVKAALWQSAVNAHDFLYYIHAGVVGTGEACILLPAPPGSGKSSLTAALSHSGFLYFTDEVALIERETLKVPPVPLALCVKSTGWDLMARYYPEISTLPTHRRTDGKVVRYMPPPHTESEAKRLRSAPVSHIFFPQYSEAEPPELEPISRTEALRGLMDECLALRQQLTFDTVCQLVRWIAGIDCYKLTFSSLDEAVGLIQKVVGFPS